MVPLERNLYGHSLAGLLWERQFEEVSNGTWVGKSAELGIVFVHRKQGLFLSVYVDDIKMDGKRTECDSHVEESHENMLMLTNQLHILITCIWDALNVNVGRTKSTLMITEKCSNHEFPGWEKPHAKTVAWSYDVEGHAQQCVERYCELANKRTEQLYKVSNPCLDDHHFKKEELESVGELSKVCSHIDLNACTWHELVALTFFGH